MHKFFMLSISLAMALSVSVRAADVEWTPGAKDIAKLESVVNLSSATLISPGSKPPAHLSEYARIYAGVTIHGRRMIRGVLLLGTPTGASVVRETMLPEIMDGGCGIIYLLYDVEASRVASLRCNGVA